MSAVNAKFARYVYASFAKHLKDCLSFPLIVDLLECPDSTWHEADAKASAHVEGPHVTNNKTFAVAVTVKLTSNRSDNDYDHVEKAGVIQNCLDRCIVIYDHESTGEGTTELATVTTTEEVRVLHIEPEQTDQQLHSIVTARYSGDI
jgi:formyltetrahydrofolate synthetase